jgi:hypothetical protein
VTAVISSLDILNQVCSEPTECRLPREIGADLLDLNQLRNNSVVHGANPVVFIEEAPAYYTARVNHEHSWLRNLAVCIVEVISVDDFMIGVRKNRKWKFQFVRQLTALVLIVDADRYDLGALSGEPIVISSQTGQLLSAMRSPIAAVEYEHNFGLPEVILQSYACTLR